MLIYILCVILAIALAISLYYGNTSKTERTNHSNTPLAYQKNTLLSKHEYAFYVNKLRPILQQYGVYCCCKVHFADLVLPKDTYNQNKWKSLFKKISAIRIDFVIVDSDMHVLLLVELHNATHHHRDRDNFVDQVCEQIGYNIIHTYGETDNILAELSTINRLETLINLLKPIQYTH